MTAERASVAVVWGGPSSEAAVSRTSAQAVHAALGAGGYRALLVELDRELAGKLAKERPDVVFPVTHGPLGEDGCLQGLLEVLELPYVGSGVLASALAASKPHAKAHFRAAGLPALRESLVRRGEPLEDRAKAVRAELGRALVVKPAAGGSAIGVGRVRADDADAVLVSALETALAADACALVEPFAVGREVTCAVLEDETGTARALPPTLIEPRAADWYDFTSRYGTQGSVHHCPAPFDEPLTRRIQEVAAGAHRALGARDLCRVDFVVGEGASDVTLLELNTLPGMTATSLFPEAAAAAGIGFVELCSRLVQRAASRTTRAAPPVVPMPP